MRIVVTGGAGFIGSHVVGRLLKRGHDVAVVDNLSTGLIANVPTGAALFEVDVCDGGELRSVFDLIQPEAVCHLAAQPSVSVSLEQPVTDATVNVIGLLHVLEASDAAGVDRIVFASSGGVLYGNVEAPAGECSPIAPICPYGISKWAGEQYLQFHASRRRATGVALRFSNVFGPKQNPAGESGVIAKFCQRMLAGDQAVVYGDGRAVRDFVHVDDAAAAAVKALEVHELPLGYLPINIGTGVGTEIGHLAERLRNLCRSARAERGLNPDVLPIKYGEHRPGELVSNLLSCSRARDLLHWKSQVDLTAGLKQTVDWFAGRLHNHREHEAAASRFQRRT